MNYLNLKNSLFIKFEENNFKELCQCKNRKSITLPINNPYNLNLTVSFPGYKAKYLGDSLVYDYRIDLNEIPISHTNIVTDIYNKAIQSPDIQNDLFNFLIDLSKNALNVNLNDYPQLSNYKFRAPSNQLLDIIKIAHGDKNYNADANSWSYSFKELSTIIPYIVLQEDINYPMPRFNGRRMSFYRYIEAILCTSAKSNHSIKDVISRTLSHTKPKLWSEFTDFYKPITNLA